MSLQQRNEEMKAFFDEHAGEYDRVHSTLMQNKERMIPFLPENTQILLDLGAGTGLELLSLYERFPAARTTVVDISPKQLNILRTRPFADKLTFLCGDFFALEFGSDYDAVISSAALHHFEEAEKSLLYRKIFACLRPGGVFINSDKMLPSYEAQLANFQKFREQRHLYRHFDTPLALCREEALLKEAGFLPGHKEPLPQGEGYWLLTATKPQ